ncbi:uncharacterized protein LOC100184167 [Ciona intestinalis]
MEQLTRSSYIPVLEQNGNQGAGHAIVAARYKGKIRKLSIAQLIIGCLSVLIGVILFVFTKLEQDTGRLNNFTGDPTQKKGNEYLNIGEGIWCGVWIIIAGASGLEVGGKTNRHQIIANIVVQILSCIFSTVLVGISLWLSLATNKLFFIGCCITHIILGVLGLVISILNALLTTHIHSVLGGGNGISCCSLNKFSLGRDIGRNEDFSSSQLQFVRMSIQNPSIVSQKTEARQTPSHHGRPSMAQNHYQSSV